MGKAWIQVHWLCLLRPHVTHRISGGDGTQPQGPQRWISFPLQPGHSTSVQCQRLARDRAFGCPKGLYPGIYRLVPICQTPAVRLLLRGHKVDVHILRGSIVAFANSNAPVFWESEQLHWFVFNYNTGPSANYKSFLTTKKENEIYKAGRGLPSTLRRRPVVQELFYGFFSDSIKNTCLQLGVDTLQRTVEGILWKRDRKFKRKNCERRTTFLFDWWSWLIISPYHGLPRWTQNKRKPINNNNPQRVNSERQPYRLS